jgi:hypothetical protein
MEEKFLLYPAEGDIDEDEGLTRQEMLQMLARELGYTLVKVEESK